MYLSLTLMSQQSEPLFHKGYPPLNDVAGGAKRRWNCLPLAALGIVVPGLLSSLLLIMCMNANESRDTNAPTEDTLAALNVPEMPVTRVTRSNKEPAPLPWNIMMTTPPEQRAVVPSSHLEGDECVGILCRYVAITLRSTLDFRADPCNDFYRYVCGKFQGDDVFRRVQNVINTGTFLALKFTEAPLANQSAFEKAVAMYKACVGFASAYQPETIELARWMIAMNLDFLNPTRLETIDPVEMMIHYSSEQSNWSYQRRYKWPRTNEEYYSRLFLMYGVMRAEAYLFSKKILAYEEQPDKLKAVAHTVVVYVTSESFLHGPLNEMKREISRLVYSVATLHAASLSASPNLLQSAIKRQKAMTKHYNLRDRERDNSEMNGDGAGNLQALGVADRGTGDLSSGTSDTVSEQQLALIQLQLKIAEAETEKQRLMLESQWLRARDGAESNESDDSIALGGRSEEDRRLKFASLLKGVLEPLPNQAALAPMWFKDVEATLESYEVPSEWWAGLVLPQLSERARGLLCRLTAEERKAYVKLKSSILEGLRLSAVEYKRLFAG
ncbi:hypothetical protein HPB51_007974 [Rhipicephalus microplus]|uniref:Uncharacterized protein n=1 Tax=Rhipicephalus microplus TaxID=6941 RepID=A0A9J6EZP4_RHIMP|nr:hypothetical protein HPB51_007974 [Rhipicephalus microplus]